MGNSIWLPPRFGLMPGNAAVGHGAPPQRAYPESSPLEAKSAIVAVWVFGLKVVAGQVPLEIATSMLDALHAFRVAAIAVLAFAKLKKRTSPTWFVSKASNVCV